MPWSLTLTMAVSRSRRTPRRISPPSGEYLTALDRRFSTTSASRSPSAQQGRGSSGTSRRSDGPGPTGSGRQRPAGARRGPRGGSRRRNWPVSRRVVSSVRSMSAAMRVAAPTIDCARSFRSSRGRRAAPRAAPPSPGSRRGGRGSRGPRRSRARSSCGRARRGGRSSPRAPGRARRSQDDADPVGQGLEGDDLAPVEGPRPVALDVEHGHDVLPGEDRHRDLAARPRLLRSRSPPRPRPPRPSASRAARAPPAPPPWRRRPSTRRAGPGPPRRRRRRRPLAGTDHDQAEVERLLDPPDRGLQDPIPRQLPGRSRAARRSRGRAARCARAPRQRPWSSPRRSRAGRRSESGTRGRRG